MDHGAVDINNTTVVMFVLGHGDPSEIIMQIRDWPAVRVRIHPSTLEKLKASATSQYRSLNAEFTKILDEHFTVQSDNEKASGQAVGSTPDASSCTPVTEPKSEKQGESDA